MEAVYLPKVGMTMEEGTLCRWLVADGEEAATLHELAAEYGVSAERIRQIEVKAMQKMKGQLAA